MDEHVNIHPVIQALVRSTTIQTGFQKPFFIIKGAENRYICEKFLSVFYTQYFLICTVYVKKWKTLNHGISKLWLI
jgi:hypothetical protein